MQYKHVKTIELTSSQSIQHNVQSELSEKSRQIDKLTRDIEELRHRHKLELSTVERRFNDENNELR
jgi:predicted RNase H-like nuclease (RuvC/YqgF family)